MQLKDYFSNIDRENNKKFFSGIASNSKKVKKNFIFFAIKGNKEDGNKYIKAAIRKGAKVIVSNNKNLKKDKDIIFVYSNNVRKTLAEVLYKNIQYPKKLIAITGTNGKSSIADFYYQILDYNLKKVASIGTIGIKYNNIKNKLKNTTLDPIQLSSILRFLKKKKIDYVILEASSHGLDQNRLDGLLFDIGIFTNLSHDHLDYHKSMKNYLKSKLYLFNKLVKKKGYVITDDQIPEKKKIENVSIKRKLNLSLIFNERKGIKLNSHKFNDEKQILQLKFKNKIFNIVLDLIGKVQIKNVLMAILAAYKSGIKFEKIINVISKLKPVEGRFEKVGKIKNNSRVILDYAHTPAALELVLLNLKEQFPNNKISIVFGCGGERDLKKRSLMGRIADKYADKIYLTDDNPRNESPFKIRNDIKRGIKKKVFFEIPNRKKAILKALMNLNTGDILLVAGRGHENIQDYGKRKIIFSDKKIILDLIKLKNKSLSKNLKLNIIMEQSNSQISNKLKINKISINSKNIKKGDIFFAIKGKKIDGNKFLSEVIKKKSSLAIVNKINKNYPLSKQIKVKNTLKFLTECSSIFRKNIRSKIISITGSCGKTTLKEMIGLALNTIFRATYSPKSYNNKFGVPLSLFNLKQDDEFGVFEVGMDKKGEIDFLTKITRPDLGIITNISYAHSKNFKKIKDIANAKGEIIRNIQRGGAIILNKDDNFYDYHKNKAIKNKLRVISFGITDKSSMTSLVKVKKFRAKYELQIKTNNELVSFFSQNNYKNNLYNILATVAVVNEFTNIKNLKKNFFLNFRPPEGRGDLGRIKLKNRNIFFIDETYNSNPLSLKNAIENFDKIKLYSAKKYLILGDMLELGEHSLKQHRLISNVINKTKIDQVYVIGKHIKKTFEGLKFKKKGKILNNNFEIINLINQRLDNNDHLMIKGSNATKLYKVAKELKKRNFYAV